MSEEKPDLPIRLRSAFAAWGLRNLGDEAAEEIERLRALLMEARDTRAADIVPNQWADRVDAALAGGDRG